MIKVLVRSAVLGAAVVRGPLINVRMLSVDSSSFILGRSVAGVVIM